MSEVSYQELIEAAGLDSPPSAQGLKEGDLVVMHSCIESEYHYGKVWTCAGDSFWSEGDDQEGEVEDHVFLVGFSGTFRCANLQLVNIQDQLLAEESRRIVGLLKEGRSRDELFTMLKKAVMDDLSETSDPA